MNKIEITNTTCNNFSQGDIIPIPARVVAKISNVSESYVKKLRGGNREDNSQKARTVKKIDTLLTDGMQYLVNEVSSLAKTDL